MVSQHAGLSLEEIEYVKSCFIAREMGVLCPTYTLVIGVNLPACLVIMKSTNV